MDTIKQIEEEIVKLKKLKDELAHESDELQQEIYSVKDENFGFSGKLKGIISKMIAHGHGISGLLAETYSHSMHKRFENAQEYIDLINSTLHNIRDYTSKIDQVIINLEKCKNDLIYKIQETQSWLQKSSELTT